jgi:phage-related protein (TIGR01555 family)
MSETPQLNILGHRGDRTPTPEEATEILAARVLDAYSNPAANLGFGTQALGESTQYPLTRLTNDFNLMNSLYRSHWIVRNIVNVIPADMTKNWIKVLSQVKPAALDKLQAAERRCQLQRDVLTGLQWARLYGGALGVMWIDGHDDKLDKPLLLDEVLPGTFQGLYIIDRWSGLVPSGTLVADMGDSDRGMPEYYEVQNHADDTVAKIHHSRCVRFVGNKISYYEQTAEMMWGASVIESVWEELRRRDDISASIGALVFQAKLITHTVEDIDKMFAIGNDKQIKNFWTRMQNAAMLRNNFGTQVLGKDEKMDVHSYAFAGLAQIEQNAMLNVSGATAIPMSKLFGRSPGGLNAAGSSAGDDVNYINHIEIMQTQDLAPIIDRVYPVLMMSTWGEIPNDFDYSFSSIRSISTDAMAKIAEFKGKTIILAFTSGMIDQAVAMMEFRAMADDTGMFTNITDEMIEAAHDVWQWDLADKGMAFVTGLASLLSAGFTLAPEQVSTVDKRLQLPPRDMKQYMQQLQATQAAQQTKDAEYSRLLNPLGEELP